MRKFSDFFQEILPKKNLLVKQNNKNGDANMDKNEFANTINKTNNFSFTVKDQKQLEEVYESVINENSSVDLREAIVPIEFLINQGKFSLAIQKFEELIFSSSFSKYSKNERFLIYNGLLNCHINIDSSDDVINQWAQKIQALGKDVDEIHRYYFLMGIREYNKHNFDKALVYINQSINKKGDYMNAVTMKILVSVSKKDLSYDEAKAKLNDLLNRKGLGVKEYAAIHSSYGDVAFNSRDYTIAQEHYSKSNEFSESLAKVIGIAVCQYFSSFNEIKDDGKVDIDKIDFESLALAEKKFKEIYDNRNNQTIRTIVNLSFSFYFNILSLKSDHKTILKLYEETKGFFNDSMVETLHNVVKAQVINGIFDEELVSKLGDYEQLKYEAFYYEKKGDYDKVIELLTPAFEGKYKDEKVLQLTYLNSLKESDQFEKYMQYYQKFSAHKDEVMRINYIQFLMKKGEKDSVLSEIKELKTIAKNGFVLYDLLMIYLDYKLEDELDEFFERVDSGIYNIIGLHKPFVFYQKMLHLLNTKKYDAYFMLYESTNLSFLGDSYRLILKINYYMFKHDLDKLASAFYEYFQFTQNHNELIKAVQIKLQINQYHEAEFYLEQVNPMMLEEPEYYYIFKAIILKEKKQLEKAFQQLQIVLDNLEISLESPFHQFYTAFNMNNNRTDVAFRYMGEYYAKNPNPYWFKVIQYSENDTGRELLAKLEEAIGGKRDLSEINRFLSQGVIGASVYNKLVGTGFEEILFMNHYPFTRVTISRGNVLETKSKIGIINDKLIVDSATLIILASSSGLTLLDVFNEIIVPYTTITSLTEKKSGMFNKYAKKALEYVSNSPRIRRLSVDEATKIKRRYNKIFPEDILDCIELTRNITVPFLNTEVAINFEYKLTEIIDINALSFFLKENHYDKRESVSKVIANMRKVGFDFLSFDADDMYNVYKSEGVEGIMPFLKMGKNADYKTFPPVYVNFLGQVYNDFTEDEFESCSREIIRFMDKYLEKTRFYSSEVIRRYPSVENSMIPLIQKPSIRKIMNKKASFDVLSFNKYYLEVLETTEFNKLVNIASAFIVFVFQFVSLFNEDKKAKDKYIEFLKDNLTVNEEEDIQYILHFMRVLEQGQKGS